MHTYKTGIGVMVSAHILGVRVEYSTPVPIPNTANTGIGAALVIDIQAKRTSTKIDWGRTWAAIMPQACLSIGLPSR